VVKIQKLPGENMATDFDDIDFEIVDK